MTAKAFVETLTAIKGIGEAKAEAIVAAGFDSFEKIQKASVSDLTAIKGISETVAQSLIKEANQKIQSAPAKSKPKPKQSTKKEPSQKEAEEKPKEKTVTKAPKPPQKKQEESEDTPETTGYQVKQKPELAKDQKHYLNVRKKIKQRTPTFLREEWFRYKRIPKNWRRPDGITSKMRRNQKYRPSRVRVGFRGPKAVRGLHPSGFEEIMVHTVSELETLNPKVQAARIGSSVGTKKRRAIEKKAKELQIRILNL